MYPKTEVHNLGRYLTIMRIRQLSWRQAHSYLVADRFDVIETQDNDQFNTVSFFGYVRGTYFDKSNQVHLNGLGDYELASVTRVEDPCPIEKKVSAKQKQKEL
mmetsp:Transcript_5025/g.4597  ORF Transcript_5025/g.4597 Transcript_5025/m.4597 type:complete len:103 (+) Transcript_5025:479-787(+)